MTRTSLGVSATSHLSIWQTIDTLDFMERCHKFGAAGIQAVLNGDPLEIRARAEQYEMYLEAMVPLPAGDDTAEFEQSLRTAEMAGATAMRAACLGTRRYESFQTIKAWHAHVDQSHRSLKAALPLLDRYKIPLGLENHKDWTTDELLALMKQYSSEYLGVCLDFGNNLALHDLPGETIGKLAPFTVSTHVKDVAVASYENGILLSEVILGQGCIDLPWAINLIRRERPATRMTLEMITRDPLKIPMLTPEYWTTFPDSKASKLAATLVFADQHRAARREVLATREDENIRRCFDAWQKAGLSAGAGAVGKERK